MTQRQLEKLCQRWQARLGLSDWTIRIRWADLWEMRQDDTSVTIADLEAFAKKRWAEIRVLRPAQMNPELLGQPGADVERSVVHELLHILFDPFGLEVLTDAEDIAREASIDTIARALVELAGAGGTDARNAGRRVPRARTGASRS